MGGRTNRHTAWRGTAVGISIAVLSCGLAACSADDRHAYFAYSDNIVSDVGDATATNQAAQTVDPWSSASRNEELPLDGNRAHASVKRYQSDTVKKPQGLTGSSGPGQSNGAPAVK